MHTPPIEHLLPKLQLLPPEGEVFAIMHSLHEGGTKDRADSEHVHRGDGNALLVVHVGICDTFE